MDHCHCYPSFHTYYIQLKCTVCNFFLNPEISLSHGQCNDSWYFSMLHVFLSLPVSCLPSPFFVGITTLLIRVVSYLKYLVSWFLHLYYGSIFHCYGTCYAKYCKFQQWRSVFLEFNFLNWHKHLEKHCFSRSRVNFILNYANMLVNWHKNYSHLPCHHWSISIFFPLTPSLTHILPPHTLAAKCMSTLLTWTKISLKCYKKKNMKINLLLQGKIHMHRKTKWYDEAPVMLQSGHLNKIVSFFQYDKWTIKDT